jgi:AcrR family transcriptional regulator
MKIRVARKPADAYQHGNLRDALVQAGLKLLSEGGVAGLSLRAAAQLAGVSHAAPYRHFKDKEQLVAAIAEQGYRLLSASIRAEEQRAGATSVRERLRAQGHGYVKFALAHPAYLQVIFGGVLNNKDGCPADLLSAGQEAFGLLRGAVAEGIANGELRPGDPDVLAIAAWSMVHGLSDLLINGALERKGHQLAVEPLVDAVLGLLAGGMNQPPAGAAAT